MPFKQALLALVLLLTTADCHPWTGAGAATPAPDPRSAAGLRAYLAGGGAIEPLALRRAANGHPRIDFGSHGAGCVAEGSRVGEWSVRYHGFGCVRVDSEQGRAALVIAPSAPRRAYLTHAPLVLGPRFEERVLLDVRMETVRQLRPGTPNPWEVGWVVWQYLDDTRFYYFIPKPNGWELGKRDPSYPGGQRFIASGTDRTFPIGRAYTVTVLQDGADMAVFVDGEEVVRTRDDERPYRAGNIGVYSEDSAVRVHYVRAG